MGLLHRLRQLAAENGTTLLSLRWQGWHEHYRFRCPNNHEWTRTAANTLYHTGVVCIDCRKAERLAQIRQAAQARGGDCLETTSLGNKPHRFICARNYEWRAAPRTCSKDAGAWSAPNWSTVNDSC